MATTLTVTTPPSVNSNEQIWEGTIALTGNYGGASTHGDTVDLTTLTYGGLSLQLSSSLLAISVIFTEGPASGTAPTYDTFLFCPGTTLANGVINVSSQGTEYTEASAYSAGLLAAVIRFKATFQTL